ncbi:helix-turn-helix domain-containing protein [Calothrix sp. NIES-3974]|uniref:helix-turn-helix domain-containing protein n=1 Tax=Calothrix sp. NIES-3974 TaxID=2005462 RepID=UPI000B5E15EB|nr:helix-turn-helix domain-containing protein [Calothrix sp. NIES-3974]BAZ06934.1 hypothetical protein NIES3974_35960 [Calothrix sp. NIES-3974]
MKLLNEVQEDKFKTISGYLKQARIEKSLSLEEVAMTTLVPMAALQALETGQAENLPEAVYVQGFIRRFGDAVGLNGKELAAEFAEACLPPPEPVKLSQQDSKTGISLSLVTPYVVFITLVVAASVGLFYILKPPSVRESTANNVSKPVKNQPNSQPQSLPTPTKPETTPEVQVSPTPAGNPISTPVATSTPELISNPTPTPTATPTTTPIVSDAVKIQLDIQEEAWVRVKVDGKTEFEGTLKPGEVKTWSGSQFITVESGNAGGVLVSQNGQPPEPMGAKYAVSRKRFEATPPQESSSGTGE